MNLQVVPQFKVIDESEDWIVIDKPAHLIVHPANSTDEPTLLGGLKKLLAFEIAAGGDLGIVTRLDRETSGVVLISKHLAAARDLGKLFELRQVMKSYLAVAFGWPSENAWQCNEPIIRMGMVEPSSIWVRQTVDPRGRECSTEFEVVARFERAEGKFSLIRCLPKTGRMHQIRVHLAHAGHPIVGEKLYSGSGQAYLDWMNHGWTDKLQKKLILPRHALHASDLSFQWRDQSHCWTSPLPGDLAQFVKGEKFLPNPEIVIWNRND